jgi:hypothetical protein
MSELMTIEMVDKLKNVLSCNKKNLAVLLNVTNKRFLITLNSLGP